MKRQIINLAVLSAATIIGAVACVSLTQVQKDRLADIIAAVPTPSPTPTMTPTPTPTPVPTPVPSLADSFKDIEQFASANGLQIIQTGRGNMLDCRGYNADKILSDWCSKSGGAAMPAFTDAEPNGIFLRCK